MLQIECRGSIALIRFLKCASFGSRTLYFQVCGVPGIQTTQGRPPTRWAGPCLEGGADFRRCDEPENFECVWALKGMPVGRPLTPLNSSSFYAVAQGRLGNQWIFFHQRSKCKEDIQPLVNGYPNAAFSSFRPGTMQKRTTTKMESGRAQAKQGGTLRSRLAFLSALAANR